MTTEALPLIGLVVIFLSNEDSLEGGREGRSSWKKKRREGCFFKLSSRVPLLHLRGAGGREAGR